MEATISGETWDDWLDRTRVLKADVDSWDGLPIPEWVAISLSNASEGLREVLGYLWAARASSQ